METMYESIKAAAPSPHRPVGGLSAALDGRSGPAQEVDASRRRTLWPRHPQPRPGGAAARQPARRLRATPADSRWAAGLARDPARGDARPAENLETRRGPARRLVHRSRRQSDARSVFTVQKRSLPLPLLQASSAPIDDLVRAADRHDGRAAGVDAPEQSDERAAGAGAGGAVARGSRAEPARRVQRAFSLTLARRRMRASSRRPSPCCAKRGTATAGEVHDPGSRPRGPVPGAHQHE